MTLDIKTTLLICSLFVGFIAIFTLAGALARKDGRIEWGIGLGAILFGGLSVSFRGLVPDILSILFGNGFLLFGIAFCIKAIARFTGRKTRWVYAIAGLGTLLNAALIPATVAPRIAVFSVAVAAQCVLGAIAIRPGGPMRDSDSLRRFLVALFCAISFVSVIRALAIGPLVLPEWTDAPGIEPILVIAGSLAFLGLGLGLERLVSERRNAELGTALAEKELLLRELNHRTKNNILLVESLISLQASSSAKNFGETGAEELSARIRSIAASHECLSHEAGSGRIRLDDYLELVLEPLAPFGTEIRLEKELGELEVAAQKAVPIGLLVNELVTNAYKHAFGSARKGSVRVALRAEGAGALLVVSDDGSGSEWPPAHPSLGYEIVSSLIAQLHGKIERVPGLGPGTVLEIRFALG